MPSDLTNKQLQAEAQAMAKQLAHDSDEITKLAAVFHDEAADTFRIVSLIGAKKVDPDTVAETSEVAKVIDGLSDAVVAYASGAKDTSRSAAHVAQTTAQVHNNIGEQVNRSPATNIHSVHRTWLEQQ